MKAWHLLLVLPVVAVYVFVACFLHTPRALKWLVCIHQHRLN
jgi:hypothetical protein